MAKPIKSVTPDNRVERWKKLWATPRLLDTEQTEAAFEEFQEQFVTGHMNKQFLKGFGVPKAHFGNRFFMEDAVFTNWNAKLSLLGVKGVTHVDVIVIYGSPDELEGYALRGEVRRTLRDIVIDDWQAACAIVRTDKTTLYVFVEPKMNGCMVRTLHTEDEE